MGAKTFFSLSSLLCVLMIGASSTLIIGVYNATPSELNSTILYALAVAGHAFEFMMIAMFLIATEPEKMVKISFGIFLLLVFLLFFVVTGNMSDDGHTSLSKIAICLVDGAEVIMGIVLYVLFMTKKRLWFSCNPTD